MTARVAIVQFPGVNCESETALALERAGLTPEIFRWKRRAAELAEFQAYVLPGGFSYQDRVRAGKRTAEEVSAAEQRRGFTRGAWAREALVVIGRAHAGTPVPALRRPRHPIRHPLVEIPHHVERPARRHAGRAGSGGERFERVRRIWQAAGG